MIKIAVVDADVPLAGELVRILVNHPESDLRALYAPALSGRRVASVHHGLIGEIPLKFTDKIDYEDIDVLILPHNHNLNLDPLLIDYPNIKIISLTGKNPEIYKNDAWKIGVSEINRKALVRDAKYAYIPSPVIVPSLIALAPLANYLILNSDIEISVTLPRDLIDDSQSENLIRELEQQINCRQNSFNSTISLKTELADSSRSQVTEISLKNNLPLDEIMKIYESIYDDHNFTFVISSDIQSNEVEGTQKTIIIIDKPQQDILKIKIINDARMRGGAGDIVHVLNLFFGLHEKTGLHLKTSAF